MYAYVCVCVLADTVAALFYNLLHCNHICIGYNYVVPFLCTWVAVTFLMAKMFIIEFYCIQEFHCCLADVKWSVFVLLFDSVGYFLFL